jgi:hypothetical protein
LMTPPTSVVWRLAFS